MAGLLDEDSWSRIDVSDWAIRSVEQRGSTRNLWLEEPGTDRRWLHKDTVIPANGVEQGEDWSEIVSSEVAGLLGVPAARTRMCVRHGRRGSISLSVVPRGHSLNEGMVVLEREKVSGYFPHNEGLPGVDPERPGIKRPGHSLRNIRAALAGVAPPPDFGGPDEMGAFEAFAGYVVLDALIANRDRHEHNWAVLTPQLVTSPEMLSPTYDHASSLGFNLTDPQRMARLASHRQLTVWAEKGTAYRFEHEGKPVTLVGHAADAIELCTAAGADWWRQRVTEISLEPVLAALRTGSVPDLSEPAARFAHDLLNLNLGRLRDAIRHAA